MNRREAITAAACAVAVPLLPGVGAAKPGAPWWMSEPGLDIDEATRRDNGLRRESGWFTEIHGVVVPHGAADPARAALAYQDAHPEAYVLCSFPPDFAAAHSFRGENEMEGYGLPVWTAAQPHADAEGEVVAYGTGSPATATFVARREPGIENVVFMHSDPAALRVRVKGNATSPGGRPRMDCDGNLLHPFAGYIVHLDEHGTVSSRERVV